jgi:AraC family transcriptional regulator of adaptative response / DNA-3-methyladenine glycosylase II
VTLGYRAPYDIPALLKFAAQRAIPGVESVGAACIRRSVRAGVLGAAAGWVEAEFKLNAALVCLRFSSSLADTSGALVSAVRRWLDLDADPATIDAALSTLPGAPGLRLPGGLDAFELAVRAVLGQQVTVAAARTLAARVVDRFGTTTWPEVSRLFPAPATLAALPLERIAELGIIRSRAGAIVALAQAWPALALQLRSSGDPEALIGTLCALPGIGPWTAHYIVMRALGWPDAFPPNDVAVLKAMKQLFDTKSQREAEARASAWQPWRAYAVLRLWNSLETKS